MAELTIKEKAMKAWLGDLEVEVRWNAAWVERGYINSYQPVIVLRIDTDECVKYDSIQYTDITDIRFVDEVCEEEKRDVSVGVELYAQVEKLKAENAELKRRHIYGDCSETTLDEIIAKKDELIYEVDALKSENAELKRSLSEPTAVSRSSSEPEPHDIAKERWGWMPVGTGEGLVRLDVDDAVSHVDSPEQKELQAAAPELADRLRELTHQETITDGVLVYIVTDAIRLLRKLGVPNVAPWYKEDGEKPEYDFKDIPPLPVPGKH